MRLETTFMLSPGSRRGRTATSHARQLLDAGAVWEQISQRLSSAGWRSAPHGCLRRRLRAGRP
jgi:hypothetical protein